MTPSIKRLLSYIQIYKYTTVAIFVAAIITRCLMWNQIGGDQHTYKKAVVEFTQGINPYEYTVKSFETPGLKKGYAYFPPILYIQTFFYKINYWFKLEVPLVNLWKIPVLLAELAIGFMLLRYFDKVPVSKKWLAPFAVAVWFFNPYFVIKQQFTYYDPLPVLPLLIAFALLGKKDFFSGLWYSLAFSFKTFPIIFLPIFLAKTRKKAGFILGGILLMLLISLPFITTLKNLDYYVHGALLVHGERGIQGRPFITFVSHLIKIPSIQDSFFSIYAAGAIILPWIAQCYLIFKKKEINEYILALTGFLIYFLVTPVFNRTHILWSIPFLLIGGYEMAKKTENGINKYVVYTAVWYVFMAVYLWFWTAGFK